MEEVIKIVLLGDASTGKTCFSIAWDKGVPNTGESKPTLGVGFISKQVEICGTQYTIQLWDTAVLFYSNFRARKGTDPLAQRTLSRLTAFFLLQTLATGAHLKI